MTDISSSEKGATTEVPGVDQEGSTARTEAHGPRALPEHKHRCVHPVDSDSCARRGYCECVCGAWMEINDDEWMRMIPLED